MLVASLPGIRRASSPVPVTADVRQRNVSQCEYAIKTQRKDNQKGTLYVGCPIRIDHDSRSRLPVNPTIQSKPESIQ